MKTPTKEDVMRLVREAPVTRDQLAHALVGGPNVRVGKSMLYPLIDELHAEGRVRKAHIQGRVHLVTADWVMPDRDKLAHIMSKCVPTEGGCMEYRGHFHGGVPWVYFPGESPTRARRAVWQIVRNVKLGLDETPRMKCQNDCCVEYRHMVLGSRADSQRGRKRSMVTRLRLANKARKRGNLDWDKVQMIRSSSEGHRKLAARLGIPESTVRDVRTYRTWREYGGMFTGLLAPRKAA